MEKKILSSSEGIYISDGEIFSNVEEAVASRKTFNKQFPIAENDKIEVYMINLRTQCKFAIVRKTPEGRLLSAEIMKPVSDCAGFVILDEDVAFMKQKALTPFRRSLVWTIYVLNAQGDYENMTESLGADTDAVISQVNLCYGILTVHISRRQVVKDKSFQFQKTNGKYMILTAREAEEARRKYCKKHPQVNFLPQVCLHED